MAERLSACWYGDGCRRWPWLAAAALMLLAGQNRAQAQVPDGPAVSAHPQAQLGPASSAAAQPAQATPRPRAWVSVPRLRSRLQARDLGLVINSADPYSVAVGEHYLRARGLQPWQVLRVRLPVVPVLSPDDFEALRQSIERHFGPQTQALALAWAAPYAVACNAITGALALGFDASLCSNGCAPSRGSGYFNSATTRPFTTPGWRPSMLLAAPTVAQAVALIDRGVASDGSLFQSDREPVSALMLVTDDRARAVRMALYPPTGLPPALGVDLWVENAAALQSKRRVLTVTTGSDKLELQPAPDWVPGALADHLTSFGGDLQGQHGQATALDWIASGATASHGAVSEPCNHPQKFPHPQVLLLHYLQGATAIEAYWKSVAWP
ncbi:MAG: TIGR03790 family protein, partial [Rubrivivax sp.]|nr:TIGR03790 family protein [Rubrivivax sp.]